MSDPLTIPSGVRTTLRVLAGIHAELDSTSRTNAGSGSSEHTAASVAPAVKAQKVA